MSERRRPIGVFDSGIGGLTVLKEIRRETPHEDLVYFGDTARVPYGTKSKETITRFSMEIVRFLKGFDVKAVVVACNTASSLSLEALREKFPEIPIVGVIEPGASAALLATRSGRVGVIGTRATIASGAYEACLKRLEPAIQVYSQACPLFVPFVEEGWLEGEAVMKVVKTYLDPLKNFGIDTLILGCTHYPLLAQAIRAVLGDEVTLVSSAEETARLVKALLSPLKDRRSEDPGIRFYVSDEPEPFRALGERFLGTPIHSVAKVGDFLPENPSGTPLHV